MDRDGQSVASVAWHLVASDEPNYNHHRGRKHGPGDLNVKEPCAGCPLRDHCETDRLACAAFLSFVARNSFRGEDRVNPTTAIYRRVFRGDAYDDEDDDDEVIELEAARPGRSRLTPEQRADRERHRQERLELRRQQRAAARARTRQEREVRREHLRVEKAAERQRRASERQAAMERARRAREAQREERRRQAGERLANTRTARLMRHVEQQERVSYERLMAEFEVGYGTVKQAIRRVRDAGWSVEVEPQSRTTPERAAERERQEAERRERVQRRRQQREERTAGRERRAVERAARLRIPGGCVSFGRQLGKWCAYVKDGGRQVYVGCHPTEEGAGELVRTALARMADGLPPKEPRPTQAGEPGLAPRATGWGARIQIDGKSLWLGVFPTVELAREAYQTAKKKLLGFGLPLKPVTAEAAHG